MTTPRHQMTKAETLHKAGFEVWKCSCGEFVLIPLDEAYHEDTDTYLTKHTETQ